MVPCFFGQFTVDMLKGGKLVKKIAIIGSGISGATCASLLRARGFQPVVFEKAATAGGLIKCTREEGNLFHRVGGHVFNSKEKCVSDWFWSMFSQNEEFAFSTRNAGILFGEKIIGYPIENHIFQLEKSIAVNAIRDLLSLSNSSKGIRFQSSSKTSFKEFLLNTFGQTLCESYFFPYNEKIWRLDLSTMPIGWLDGKLPAPSVEEVMISNILREDETKMVHSRFYYPKNDGSQFIVNRILEGIDVRLNHDLTNISINRKNVIFSEEFDGIIYTGDVRKLRNLVNDDSNILAKLSTLRSNGTTTILCSCDANPYSWVYIPSEKFYCHRIIMTGNFSATNNSTELGKNRISCTVEFVGNVSDDLISNSVSKLPFNLKIITKNYEPNSYIIQDDASRINIAQAKDYLKTRNIWLCGRFAEWEYFNMDVAIASAMRTVEQVTTFFG